MERRLLQQNDSNLPLQKLLQTVVTIYLLFGLRIDSFLLKSDSIFVFFLVILTNSTFFTKWRQHLTVCTSWLDSGLSPEVTIYECPHGPTILLRVFDFLVLEYFSHVHLVKIKLETGKGSRNVYKQIFFKYFVLHLFNHRLLIFIIEIRGLKV